MSLKNMARPERFELPTLWFEDRGRAFSRYIESRGFYLLWVEAVAADLLVSVEFLGPWKQLQLRNRLQRKEGDLSGQRLVIGR